TPPGTLAYMAPEQVDGLQIDTRTDIFAFGLVLFEMLAGRRAFQGTTHASLSISILEETPRPISRLQLLAPPALNCLLARCLAKDHLQFWQSSRDVSYCLNWIATEL